MHGWCVGWCLCIKQDTRHGWLREHEVDLSRHQRRLWHKVCVGLTISCTLDNMTHDATLIYGICVVPEDVWVRVVYGEL